MSVEIHKVGNKYTARVWYYDRNGDRKSKFNSDFVREKDANRWATAIQKRADDGQITIDSSTPLAKYFWDWYQIFKEPAIEERTRASYVQTHNVLVKYFPVKPIDSINRRDYQKFLKEYGTARAKSTVTKNSSLIHACVKDALYDGTIVRDFVSGTKPVFDPKKTREIEYLSMSDLDTLKNYVKNTLNPHFTGKYMILMAIYTGMRLGEIQGLKWSDINVRFKTIAVRRSWNESERDFKKTKNKSSVRMIRINSELIEILRSLHDTVKPVSNDQVFINQYHTVPTSSAVNKTLKQCFKDTGIERSGFHFHSLRHTHVAYLLANQIDLYVISKRLGHADIGTTTRTYSYLIEEYKVKTDNQIENVLDKIGKSVDDDELNMEVF